MIHSRWSRQGRRPRDEGQSLVEFALVAPLLLILVVGIFEFARAWQVYQALTDAAREVARNAVVETNICEFGSPPGFCPADPSNCSDVLNAIANYRVASSAGDVSSLTFSTDPALSATSPCDAAPGAAVTVDMSLDYRFVFVGALLGWLTGDQTITLDTQFVMRKE